MRKITLTLIAIVLVSAGYVAAQVTKSTPVTVPASQITVNNDEPLQISDDLGLRIEGRHDGRVVGTLVVKVDGRWMDVQLATKNVQLGR